LTFLEGRFGNALGVRASGTLTRADYQQLVPRLEELIRQHGRVRVLFDLEDCRGWQAGAAWDDLKFALRHGGDVERCAVVGGRKWQEWLTRLSRPFFKVRYFDRARLDRARRWLLDGARRRSEPGAGKRRGPGILSGLTNCRHA
jgi:hypothetical protein